jgi:hypothetical protein
MYRTLASIGLSLAVIGSSPLARADQPSAPAAPTTGLPGVSFAGQDGAELMLDDGRTCKAPCTLHDVAPGFHALTIDGRPSRGIVVQPGPTTVVRLRGGSPTMLVIGVALVAAGTALFVGGLSTSNNCASSTSSSTPSVCVSIPLTLEATGVLWGVAGITLGIIGAIQSGKTRLDTRSPEATMASSVPRVVPWASPVTESGSGVRGGVGGVAVFF